MAKTKTIIFEQFPKGRGLSPEEAPILVKEINYKIALSGGIFELKIIPGGQLVLDIQGMHSNASEDIDKLFDEFFAKSQKVIKESEINKKRISVGKPPIRMRIV